MVEMSKVIFRPAWLYVQNRESGSDSSIPLLLGDGTVSAGPDFVTLMGKLAPGPDYKLCLSPEFVETEAEFNRLKSGMVRVGDVMWTTITASGPTFHYTRMFRMIVKDSQKSQGI